MATPISVSKLIEFLEKWDVNYKKYENWETHNRNHKGPFGPVNGVMWHHTGSDSKDQRDLLRNGRTGLPGPLSQYGIAQDGTVWLIGHGRANHAGSGDDDVLGAVIDEVVPPVDNETNTDGNQHFYGIEFWYSGSHPMTDAQYFSGIRLSCALMDYHNWTGASVIGHGEWQPGKWDPGYAPSKMMNMSNVRHDVNEALKRGPNPVPTPSANTSPSKSDIYKQVWETDAAKPPANVNTGTNSYWWPMSILTYACEQATEARKNTEAIMKHLGMDTKP